MLRAFPISFFARPTPAVACDLVGAVLAAGTGRGRVSGRIVEVEAYRGADDPASHAAGGPTPRSAVMFGPPGRAYVYLIYGVHHCLNAVTEPEGEAGAVLIRAVEPLTGLATMARRRGPAPGAGGLCDGPGKLCRAFGIDRGWDGESLAGPRLIIRPGDRPPERVVAGPRIGVRTARGRPWRFVDPDSPCLSAPPSRI